MFRSNQGHQQGLLFGWDYTMPAEHKNGSNKAKAMPFINTFFVT